MFVVGGGSTSAMFPPIRCVFSLLFSFLHSLMMFSQ
jgi:hypothetical protein